MYNDIDGDIILVHMLPKIVIDYTSESLFDFVQNVSFFINEFGDYNFELWFLDRVCFYYDSVGYRTLDYDMV